MTPSPGNGAASSDRPAAIRTFLIADVRGYTRFTQERGDEAAARLATRFAGIAREAVEAHRGEVIELRGDEALAVFDSARSAIRAAVELEQAFASETAADPTLPLKAGIGLDAGEAVAVGEGYRGGALNLAARLCARAGPGEVIASQGVVHLARTVEGIRYEPLGALELKGLQEPVNAVRVLAEEISPPGVPVEPLPGAERGDLPAELDPVTPLVGRERDLRWLRWGWRRTRHGLGRAVFVAGPEGVGKTRLAAELAREVHASGYPVLYARCAGPAHAALEAMRRARSVDRPTLVVVDDLDLAGGTVLDALDALVASVAGRPLMVLGTHRDGSPPPTLSALLERARPPEASRRRLEPLDEEGVRRIADLYAGPTASRLPIGDILKETGGIPGLVHRVVSEWVRAEAARSLGSSADRAATGRSGLRAAEAELATNVIDLQLARERTRLYAAEIPETEIDRVICPFKGLAPFEAEDADYFFGRERLVAEIVARLVGASFLGVVGPSGSGKSSAVRAGLLPALASGVLPGSDRWPTTVMRPGDHPLEELRRGLPGTDDGSVEGLLRRAAEAGEEGRLVLLVDQFEEVFTACRDEEERAAFVRALLAGIRETKGRAVVVAAIRADYYGRCASYPDLAALLGVNHVLVGPMTEEELRRAIELPARRVGLRVEPELADALVADVVGEPGALPLLSTTLLELWQRRQGRTLTTASYRETGGVRGAVARLAEDAYGRLSEDQQRLARSILLRLAGLGDGEAAVRRRVPLAELDVERNEDAARVLAVLTDARLVTTSDGFVEVAHEALLREWPRLRGWLEEDVQGRRLHLHLAQTAREWEEGGREDADLYRGARLASALDWTATHGLELNELEREFIEHSRLASEREAERQRRVNRRLRGLLAGVAVFLVVALVAGGLALVQRGRAERAARIATARELAAAADANLTVDPERSILLALEAVETARPLDGDTLRVAEEALHRAVVASRVLVTVEGSGNFVALSPDGSRLVSAYSGGAAIFVGTGDVVSVLDGAADVRGAAWSPDESRIATASGNGTMTIWRASDGRELRTVAAHEGGVLSVVFSPDGGQVATLGIEDGRAALWDASAGDLVQSFEAYTGGPVETAINVAEYLSFSPEGERLAVGVPLFAQGEDEPGVMARVWNLRSGRLELALEGGPGVEDVQFSPDGTLLAIARGDMSVVNLRDARTGRQLATLYGHRSNVYDVEFNADGTRLATASADGTARVWELTSDPVGGKELSTLAGHGAFVTELAFGPEDVVATASTDGTTRLWDASPEGRGELLVLPGLDPSSSFNGDVEFTPDGRRLVSSSRPDGVAREWDVRTGEELLTLEGHAIGSAVNGIDVSPDGTMIATASVDKLVKVWDAASGEELFTFSGHAACPLDCFVLDVEFSPDGSLFASGGVDATARIVETATGEERTRFEGHKGIVFGIEFSPDGRHVATASWDGTARVWDVESGEYVVLAPGSEEITSVSFSPDGALLAMGGFDGSVRVWDWASAEQLSEWPADPGGVFDVAFSPDGTLLAAGGPGGITLWNVATGSLRLALTGPAWRLTFSPDQRYVAASTGPFIRVFVVGIEDLIELARSGVTRSLTDDECRQYLHQEECPANP